MPKRKRRAMCGLGSSALSGHTTIEMQPVLQAPVRSTEKKVRKIEREREKGTGVFTRQVDFCEDPSDDCTAMYTAPQRELCSYSMVG